MSLSPDFNALVSAARDAATRSYSPYSKYAVGAALLTEDGRIFSGCNVENAAYGLTLCAERNAITTAVAAGCRRFLAIAIAGGTTSAPAYPCGSCRQVLAEFCTADLPVAVAPLDPAEGSGETIRLGDLLPYSFSL